MGRPLAGGPSLKLLMDPSDVGVGRARVVDLGSSVEMVLSGHRRPSGTPFGWLGVMIPISPRREWSVTTDGPVLFTEGSEVGRLRRKEEWCTGGQSRVGCGVGKRTISLTGTNILFRVGDSQEQELTPYTFLGPFSPAAEHRGRWDHGPGKDRVTWDGESQSPRTGEEDW